MHSGSAWKVSILETAAYGSVEEDCSISPKGYQIQAFTNYSTPLPTIPTSELVISLPPRKSIFCDSYV